MKIANVEMKPGHKRYVNCIVHSEVLQGMLLLIEKERPPWQKGKLNGIGGKIEGDETLDQAADRELFEEAGLHRVGPWRHFVTLVGKDGTWVVYFLIGAVVHLHAYKQKTDEKLHILRVWDLWQDHRIINNLRWLIPLAMDAHLDVPIEIVDHYVNH